MNLSSLRANRSIGESGSPIVSKKNSLSNDTLCMCSDSFRSTRSARVQTRVRKISDSGLGQLEEVIDMEEIENKPRCTIKREEIDTGENEQLRKSSDGVIIISKHTITPLLGSPEMESAVILNTRKEAPPNSLKVNKPMF